MTVRKGLKQKQAIVDSSMRKETKEYRCWMDAATMREEKKREEEKKRRKESRHFEQKNEKE